MCFVACQKQSLPAHYIYSTSCFHCCNALSSERGKMAPRVEINPEFRHKKLTNICESGPKVSKCKCCTVGSLEPDK